MKPTVPTVNVCLASYTTAQARLKLYSYLDQLGELVLYYDTDSVTFVLREGGPGPKRGTRIGGMTDELESMSSRSHITEFSSGDPKNYG